MLEDALFRASGAAAWGKCAYPDLLGHMTPSARARAEGLCPGAAGVYAAAFPYYAGAPAGNLSLYARGEDYHRVLSRRLEGVAQGLQARYPGHCFHTLVDNSPLPEKVCAALAGLGFLGRHTLTILPPWGSYLFLGTILTDLPLPSARRGPEFCTGCGNCLSACPTGALSEGGVDRARCLSALTQKKGELTGAEEAALSRHPCAWGCDLCQRACPHNAAPPLTPLEEFREELLPGLTSDALAGLTNRQFLEKYPGRAFTWRGVAVLRRNLVLQAGEGPPPAPDAGGKREA